MSAGEKSTSWMQRLKRQEIWTWRPVPTVRFALIVYISIAVIFLSLGIAILVESSKLNEVSKRYDDTSACSKSGQNCTLTLEVDEDLTAPVYVYYGLTDFYQNHRLYFKSRNPDQLSGDDLAPGDMTSCSPVTKMKDLERVPIYEQAKEKLKPDDAANPCGLIAKSFFNDTYALYAPDKSIVEIKETDISWDSDDEKLGRPKDYESLQWLDVSSGHFKVWMRTAASSNFRKLWGRITKNLKKGTYTLEIANNYDVSQWHGEKEFVLSTTSRFGGKNYLLGGLFVAGGGFSIIISIVFLFVSRRNRSKTLEEYFPESEAVFKKLQALLNPDPLLRNPD